MLATGSLWYTRQASKVQDQTKSQPIFTPSLTLNDLYEHTDLPDVVGVSDPEARSTALFSVAWVGDERCGADERLTPPTVIL